MQRYCGNSEITRSRISNSCTLNSTTTYKPSASALSITFDLITSTPVPGISFGVDLLSSATKINPTVINIDFIGINSKWNCNLCRRNNLNDFLCLGKWLIVKNQILFLFLPRNRSSKCWISVDTNIVKRTVFL